MSILRIAVGQFNFLVGGIKTNTKKITQEIHHAKQLKADLLVFPELALCSYLSEDLLLRKDFEEQIKKALQAIQAESEDIAIILGHPHYTHQGIYNAASLIKNKKIILTSHKQYLPNYGVFDEQRYFKAGNTTGLFTLKNVSIGILICEDLWHAQPGLAAKEKGAQLLIAINASPFDSAKVNQRIAVLEACIKQTQLPILYVNGVNGQDDLVFDGGSQAFNAKGELCAHADFFTEKLWSVDVKIGSIPTFIPQTFANPLSMDATIYQALVLAVRDYVTKNHFSAVLLGLSGGIDSALVLAIAVDALGKDSVHAISLPSRYTSKLSQDITIDLTEKLNISLEEFSIESSFSAFLTTLNLDPNNPPAGIMTENLQARCRAVILMALSNQRGHLLLNCTNKSELAVGYGTLYGDMAGGFSVLSDVYKTQVYQLAHYRNTINPIFSTELLSRSPSAELANHQKDADTLPPYEELDAILKGYIEQDKSIEDIVNRGFSRETVQKIVNLVNKNEHKRRQLALGPRISTRAFHRERRYPITSGFYSSIKDFSPR